MIPAIEATVVLRDWALQQGIDWGPQAVYAALREREFRALQGMFVELLMYSTWRPDDLERAGTRRADPA